MKRRSRRGNTVIEFVLVGIPMIFVQISLFEIARLGWTFHTLTSAVSETARYAVVHGKNCGIAPNACAVTVADLARMMKSRAPGLVPSDTEFALEAGGVTISCRLDACLDNANVWPPGNAGDPGQEIEVRGTYSMRSMVSLFWPGVGDGKVFGQVRLPASSHEVIQF